MSLLRSTVGLLLVACLLVLSACSSFTGDRRHLVPVSGPNFALLSSIGSSAGAPMMITSSSRVPSWKSGNRPMTALIAS